MNTKEARFSAVAGFPLSVCNPKGLIKGYHVETNVERNARLPGKHKMQMNLMED